MPDPQPEDLAARPVAIDLKSTIGGVEWLVVVVQLRRPTRRWLPSPAIRGHPGAAYHLLMSVGTVAFWHSEDGWGAITAPDRRGIGFVHFSNVRGIESYREPTPGSSVEFEWLDDFEQDGCQWRVAWVRPI
jgi:cold shock CspA family protein